MSETKKTCLHDRHVAQGALMSPFGGFDMPIQYKGIVEEHNAVRKACGVFDVSHMGEVDVTGADAERWVNHIFTNDVTGAPAGKIFYGMMLYPDGGTVDDLLVYKLSDTHFLLVINAANIDKDVEWMHGHTEGFDVKVDDRQRRHRRAGRAGAGSRGGDGSGARLGLCRSGILYIQGGDDGRRNSRHSQPHRLYRRGRL